MACFHSYEGGTSGRIFQRNLNLARISYQRNIAKPPLQSPFQKLRHLGLGIYEDRTGYKVRFKTLPPGKEFELYYDIDSYVIISKILGDFECGFKFDVNNNVIVKPVENKKLIPFRLHRIKHFWFQIRRMGPVYHVCARAWRCTSIFPKFKYTNTYGSKECDISFAPAKFYPASV